MLEGDLRAILFNAAEDLHEHLLDEVLWLVPLGQMRVDQPGHQWIKELDERARGGLVLLSYLLQAGCHIEFILRHASGRESPGAITDDATQGELLRSHGANFFFAFPARFRG